MSHSLRTLCWVIAVALPIACSNEEPPRSPAGPDKPAAQAPGTSTATESASAAHAAPAKMAPTPGTVLRETELKDKPLLDAKTLKKLPAKTGVTVVDRQGGWLRVDAGGQQGWVRLLHVSTQPAGRAGTAAEIESAKKIATGRSGGGNVVATTGIRGLSEEQLRTAKPAPEELKKLERYAATVEQAREYARKHTLEARQIPYPPGPS